MSDTRKPPRQPLAGHVTSARLLTGQTIYMAAYDRTVEVPPGSILTVIAVDEASDRFYGRYWCGRLPVLITCPLSEVEHADPETPEQYARRGMVAVQFLESLAGRSPPDDEAMREWRAFADDEQRFVLAMAERIRYKKEKYLELAALEMKGLLS